MGKFSTVVIEPRLLRAGDAGCYVGCPGLLKRMDAAGWIKPVVQRKKMTVYRRVDLDACCARLDAGEFPEPDDAACQSEKAFSIP